LITKEVFPADCLRCYIVTAFQRKRVVTNTFFFTFIVKPDFPAYSKIYFRNYNGHVYSYGRHSPGLTSVSLYQTGHESRFRNLDLGFRNWIILES